MGKDKHLSLRAGVNTVLGKVIAHLQDELTNQKELASTTLQARFLPFVVGKDDPRFQEIALRCACQCEAWAREIREYAGLSIPTSPAYSNTVLEASARHSNDVYDRKEEDDDDEEIEDEEESRERGLEIGSGY